jgi:hypothetical protein
LLQTGSIDLLGDEHVLAPSSVRALVVQLLEEIAGESFKRPSGASLKQV